MKVNVSYTVYVPDDKVAPLATIARSMMVANPGDGDREAIKALLRLQGTSLLKCTAEELKFAADEWTEPTVTGMVPAGEFFNGLLNSICDKPVADEVLAGKEAAF